MKKILILFLSFLFITFFIPNYDYNVKAIQIGDLYICNFEQYALNTRNVTEYISGDQWLQIETDGQVTSTCKVTDDDWNDNDLNTKVHGWSHSTTSGFGDQYTWWNFTSALKNLSFDFHHYWGAQHLVYYYIYSGSTQIGNIKMNDLAGTGSDTVRITAYDESYITFDDETDIMSANVKIHTNNSLAITVYNETGSSLTAWETNLEGFITITSVYVLIDISVVLAIESWWDNITVDTSDAQEYAWTVNYNSYGDVTFDETSETSMNLISPNDYGGVDSRISNIGLANSGLTIRQIAVAVSDDTDKDLMYVYAQINNYNFGDFDASYSATIDGVDRWVLVWQQLDQHFYANTLNVEFMGVRISGSLSLDFLTTSSDVDEDNDAEHYFWGAYANPTYFDGKYDDGSLIYSSATDIIYQVWYNSTGTGDEWGGDEMAGYDVIGELFGEYSGTCIHNYVIEGTYNHEVSHYVEAVDLLITKAMYDNIIAYNEDYDDFKLNINGETDDEVEYLIPFSDNAYIMRWIPDTHIRIENETINIAFYTPDGTFGSGATNSWCVMVNPNDNNADGLVEYKRSDSVQQFSNGEYDGSSVSYDLAYRIYYTPTYVETFIYPDMITTDKDSYRQYETVKVQGTTSDRGSPYSVEAQYKAGATWYDYDGDNCTLPAYDVPDCFEYWFKPAYAGEWNVSLKKAGVTVDRAYFNVTSYNYLYYIISVPNPSQLGQNVRFYVMYNLSDSYEVMLQVKTSWKTYNFEVVNKQNETLVGSINFQVEGIYYPTLIRRYDSNYEWTDILEEIHICKRGSYSNWIRLDYEECIMNKDSYQFCIQTISYQHNFLGNPNVRILINNELQTMSIGDTSYGSVVYAPPKTGTYLVSMVLVEEDGSYTYLTDNETFYVFDHSEYEETPLLPELPEQINYIAGFVVTLICILAPLLLVLGMHRSPRDVPIIVYGLSGAIGIVISIGMGFFDIWVAFFVLGVGIIITVLAVFLPKMRQ